MRSTLLATALVASFLSPATALAADYDAYVSAPAYDWSGAYAGVQFGYGRGSDDTDVIETTTGIAIGPFGYDTTGFVGGVHIGTNVQAGAVVYGAEADFEYANIDGAFDIGGGDSVTKRINWAGSVRGRAGVAQGRFLGYATAGLAFASVEMDALEAGASVFSGSQSTLGWTAGVGAEYALGNDWRVRSEYRYTDYGETSIIGPFAGINAETSHTNRVHAVRLGFSRSF